MAAKKFRELIKILKETEKEIDLCFLEGEAAARRFDRTYDKMMRGLRS